MTFRLIGRLMILAVGCATLLLGGCCKVIPFQKCQTTNTVRVSYVSDGACNGGFNVHTRFMVLANEQALRQVHPDQIFPTPDSSLQVQKKKDFHIQPASDGTLEFSLGDLEDLSSLYLGVVAHFERIDTPGTDRIVLPLTGKKGTIDVSIELTGNRLTGALGSK